MTTEITPWLSPEANVTVGEQLQQEHERALQKALDTQGTILADLEAALNLIREYQRCLDMLGGPDPNIVAARNLLLKYGMAQGRSTPKSFRVMIDGLDITEHPDSIEGDVVDAEVLEAAEEDERRTLNP